MAKQEKDLGRKVEILDGLQPPVPVEKPPKDFGAALLEVSGSFALLFIEEHLKKGGTIQIMTNDGIHYDEET